MPSAHWSALCQSSPGPRTSCRSANVFKVTFSPDGQRIVTVSSDHTGRVGTLPMAGLLLTLRRHTHNLSSVQFSPDGQRIVTASVDNTVRVWNAADGRLLATLQGHTGYIPHARFSPDGKRIVTASWDQTPRVWEVLTLDDVSRILGNCARNSPCSEIGD